MPAGSRLGSLVALKLASHCLQQSGPDPRMFGTHDAWQQGRPKITNLAPCRLQAAAGVHHHGEDHKRISKSLLALRWTFAYCWFCCRRGNVHNGQACQFPLSTLSIMSRPAMRHLCLEVQLYFCKFHLSSPSLFKEDAMSEQNLYGLDLQAWPVKYSLAVETLKCTCCAMRQAPRTFSATGTDTNIYLRP